MTSWQATLLILGLCLIALAVAKNGQHIEAQLKRIAVAVENGTVQ